MTLLEAVDSYLSRCFNENDKTEIQKLKDAGDEDELRRRMLPRISFGTSGLRGAVQPGFARMDDLTVYQASRGLAKYLLSTLGSDIARRRGVVVGHDHRHGSDSFASITERVFLHEGFTVYRFGRLVHTPLVPFSVRELGAAAGVMITASHNPKQDNGYKVYYENGCAIIPPHDHGISSEIDRCAREDPLEPLVAESTASAQLIFDKVYPEYQTRVDKLIGTVQGSLSVVYTPMHGVGLPYAHDLASRLGVQLLPVPEQAQPDPEFSTVKFPNPEEAGALDMALALADKEGISVVVANDPDADRFCFAERGKSGWRLFTGNEIGCLLAKELLPKDKSKAACLSSAVSSRALESMCKKEGIHWEETLTGFKWLGNRALDLKQQGFTVSFAYEEALGYMPGDSTDGPFVYDKDGVLTLGVFLRLASRLYANGKTVSDALTSFYDEYGSFGSQNSYFRVSDPKLLSQVMSTLRSPYKETMQLEESTRLRVTRVRDLTTGYDSATHDKMPQLPVSASSEMITFWLGSEVPGDLDWAVLTIRGSGTEPKLKYYIEARTTSTVEHATAIARQVEAGLCAWLADFRLERANL
ncbi:hypothetical protein PYCC9005_003447 [Savitreella phatthalungensis]